MYSDLTTMFIYTETPLHAGTGTALGAIDLPIQREKYTDYPLIASSGLKGAMREWFENKFKNEVAEIDVVFGPRKNPDHASAMASTDARLLLFPIRSMKGVFVWATSPTLLHRLRTELERCGDKSFPSIIPVPPSETAFVSSEDPVLVENGRYLILEENSFKVPGREENVNCTNVAEWIKTHAIPNGDEYVFWRTQVLSKMVILSDTDFSYFVKHSTEVNARVMLGEKKTTTEDGNLFYEENMPSDSLLYSSLLASIPYVANPPAAVSSPSNIITYVKKAGDQRMQIGGNETIGRGLCKIKFL